MIDGQNGVSLPDNGVDREREREPGYSRDLSFKGRAGDALAHSHSASTPPWPTTAEAGLRGPIRVGGSRESLSMQVGIGSVGEDFGAK